MTAVPIQEKACAHVLWESVTTYPGVTLMYVSYPPVHGLIGTCPTRPPAPRSVDGSGVEVSLVLGNRGP